MFNTYSAGISCMRGPVAESGRVSLAGSSIQPDEHYPPPTAPILQFNHPVGLNLHSHGLDAARMQPCLEVNQRQHGCSGVHHHADGRSTDSHVRKAHDDHERPFCKRPKRLKEGLK